MKTIVPDYYSRFACLMGQCRHSCCIGWEIDIDPDKLAYYRALTGEIGRKLKENITEGDDGAYFRLTGAERCPFLNCDGLCQLILQLGEDSLCQICADHPRFRNFFSDREEIGLGLCCEAAAALILKNPEKTHFVTLEDDGSANPLDEAEQELLQLRGDLIEIVQDRSVPFIQRIDRMLDFAALPHPVLSPDWIDFLLALEQLDARWSELLLRIDCAASLSLSPELETAFEQLLVYLLHRHVPGALDDDDLSGRIMFAALCVELLLRLCAQVNDPAADDLVELARMYSSEIEYSDENTGAILEHLHKLYPEI